MSRPRERPFDLSIPACNEVDRLAKITGLPLASVSFRQTGAFMKIVYILRAFADHRGKARVKTLSLYRWASKESKHCSIYNGFNPEATGKITR